MISPQFMTSSYLIQTIGRINTEIVEGKRIGRDFRKEIPSLDCLIEELWNHSQATSQFPIQRTGIQWKLNCVTISFAIILGYIMISTLPNEESRPFSNKFNLFHLILESCDQWNVFQFCLITGCVAHKLQYEFAKVERLVLVIIERDNSSSRCLICLSISQTKGVLVGFKSARREPANIADQLVNLSIDWFANSGSLKVCLAIYLFP